MVIESTGFSIFNLADRFIELLLAPINYVEMLWIAVPLVLTLFLTEIYFQDINKKSWVGILHTAMR